jgi:hypothetical protein
VNPRTTGILFLVASLVVGLVWWNENVRKGEAEEAAAEAKALFPDLAAEDVRWLALDTSDGTPARLELREGAWWLVEPLEFPADRTTLEGMTAALDELASDGVIESPQAPEVYGLGEDAARVRFGTEAGEFVLRLGAQTPVGGSSYAAREGDEAVYTIPSHRASALRRSLVDLREKRVLRFDRAAVTRIELAWPGGGVTLEREGEGFRMTAPVEDAADRQTVDSLLSDLGFLRAEGFLDEPPPDAELGLEEPAFTARLGVPGEGDAPPQVFELRIGAELADAPERAARGRERSVYRIPTERLDDFPRTVSAYRFKELASFVPSDARQVELAFRDPEAGAHVVVAEHGEDGWTSSPEPLAPGRTERLVAELSTLRAREIVAESMSKAEQAALGLDPPRVRLRVLGETAEGKPAPVLGEVLLGEADHDLGIVARSASSERIYRLDFALAEHVPVSLEALRNRFLSKEGEDAAADEPAPEEGEGFDPLEGFEGPDS